MKLFASFGLANFALAQVRRFYYHFKREKNKLRQFEVSSNKIIFSRVTKFAEMIMNTGTFVVLRAKLRYYFIHNKIILPIMLKGKIKFYLKSVAIEVSDFA